MILCVIQQKGYVMEDIYKLMSDVCDCLFYNHLDQAAVLLEGDSLEKAFASAKNISDNTNDCDEILSVAYFMEQILEVAGNRFVQESINPNEVFDLAWRGRCHHESIESFLERNMKLFLNIPTFNPNEAAKTLFNEFDVETSDDFYYALYDLYEICTDLSFYHDDMITILEAPDSGHWDCTKDIIRTKILTKEELVEAAKKCCEKNGLRTDPYAESYRTIIDLADEK